MGVDVADVDGLGLFGEQGQNIAVNGRSAQAENFSNRCLRRLIERQRGGVGEGLGKLRGYVVADG